MKRLMVALGACAALSTLPMGAFAHGYEAGDAALGGLIGGVVGGLIGTTIVPAPVVVERYAPAPVVVERYDAPVVIERYAPAPIVVERAEPTVVYYQRGYGGWHGHKRDKHRWHQRHWHDDD